MIKSFEIKSPNAEKCVRPLILDNNPEEADGEYKYSVIGSCFIIKYDDDFFIITADHCLKDSRCIESNQISVQLDIDGRDFITLCCEYPATIKEKVEIELPRVYQVKKSEYPKLQGQNYVELGEIKNFGTPDNVFSRGYPHTTTNICYETNKIRTQAASINFNLEAICDIHEYCACMNINEEEASSIEEQVDFKDSKLDLDNMSGSPVFFTYSDKISLAGVLTNSGSRRSHFLCSDFLHIALVDISNQLKGSGNN